MSFRAERKDYTVTPFSTWKCNFHYIFLENSRTWCLLKFQLWNLGFFTNNIKTNSFYYKIQLNILHSSGLSWIIYMHSIRDHLLRNLLYLYYISVYTILCSLLLVLWWFAILRRPFCILIENFLQLFFPQLVSISYAFFGSRFTTFLFGVVSWCPMYWFFQLQTVLTTYSWSC